MQNIYINLFGGISVSKDGQHWVSLDAATENRVGKKQEAFLVYLLLNHKRRFSFTELMDHFWGSGAKNPANSLKNMMFKIRTALHDAFPAIEDPIVTKPDGYEWNSRIGVILDTDCFEQLYLQSKNTDSAKAVPYQLEAFDRYQGDILAGDSVDWLDHINTYYRTVYVDLCRSLAMQLLEECRWDDVIRVCSRAYMVAPEIEEFTCCSIHAMTANGLSAQAVKRYEAYRDYLWKEFQLVPSDAVEQAYALAVHSAGDTEEFGGKVVAGLIQPAEQREAFQCSMMVFQNIVQLELRHMARSDRESSLVLLEVVPPTGNGEVSATDIRRTERMLLGGLRAGDPFSRLNRGRFLVLLPGAGQSNAEKVMERLRHGFHATFPRSKAILLYHIYPLATAEAEAAFMSKE